MTSLPTPFLAPAVARAQEWEDPNQASFGDDVSLENSQDGLHTEFTIDADQTAIGWQDLQQPSNNTLSFTFTNPSDQSTVLNYITAKVPSNFDGKVECHGCTAAFVNPYGIYVGGEAIFDVGKLALIAGDINQVDFLSNGVIDAQLQGTIWNDGSILSEGNVLLLGRDVINTGEIRLEDGALLMLAGQQVLGLDIDSLTDHLLSGGTGFAALLADGVVRNDGLIVAPDATLAGGRVLNHGEIEIADGTLLMVAEDAVWFRRFDDPVSIKLPRRDVGAQSEAPESAAPEYAIENHGKIDAGLGHVRLSASDPLGFGIRQGASGSIAARRIQIEGGETGRVELAGTLDASDLGTDGVGGEIDVTGSIIHLVDAHLDASGASGGGEIQIGGEQEGQGELQRAELVVIDEESTIRADAVRDGDGGRVIVFSEGITSVDGEISARGGKDGGNGGFVETSGLARFAISKTPDTSAPKGQAGDWLIDPFDICISNDVMGCGASAPIPNELNTAIDTILDPNFDGSIFDSIIRTVGPSWVDPDIIAKALAVGTSITLSTQIFGTTTETQQVGNITIEDSILIPNSATLPSTRATLTLLAAGGITVGADIIAGTAGQDPNLSLNVLLRANDPVQNDFTTGFSYDDIQGDVVIDGDIVTGGGALIVDAVAIHQDAASTIDTDGGLVRFISGSLDSVSDPVAIPSSGDPGIRPQDIPPGGDEPFLPASTTGYAPVAITIDGTIDTSDGNDPGGDIDLQSYSVDVAVGSRTDVVTADLVIGSTATLVSGGGDVTLRSGQAAGSSGVGFAGNVHVDGSINTCALASCAGVGVGGDLSITATHIDPTGGASRSVDFVEADPAEPEARGEGGLIAIDVGAGGIQTGGGTVSIGDISTREISIDGELLATSLMNPGEQGLISIIALDELAANASTDTYGEGLISIGTNATTRLAGAGIYIEGRSVTTSDDVAGNPVLMEVAGTSSSALGNVTEGELEIIGHHSIDLGLDTSLRAESVVLQAATDPTETTEAERLADVAALQFRGDNGPGQSGVSISATRVSITTGDGTTSTSTLFEDELVDAEGVPTDFAVSRNPRGNYAGLQLEGFAAAGERPDEILIAQDAAFTISDSVNVGDSELNLERAFDGATIGADGMRITLESADGVLTIADASALNNDGVTMPDSDANKSWVTLLGGLLLPVAPDPIPDPESVPTPNSVVLGDDGGVTPLATPFDVEALVVSSSGDMTVNDQVTSSIANANELTFEAGRNTGVDDAAGRGTLTVGDVANSLLLQAGESLSLLAGASGFGDLVFNASPAQPITLRANELSLRAGAGASSLNTDASDRSAIVGLASSDIDIVDANGNAFGSDASPADVAFRYRQDASIDTSTDLPSLAQFGLLPADGFRDAGDVVYSVRSDQGIIDLDDGVVGTNEADRFRDSALSLIGTDDGTAIPLQVSSDFAFQGDSIEVGSTNGFRFSQTYANAFNRSNTNPNAQITLRSGAGGAGNLSFDANVPVVAARIDLIAGDGVSGDGTGSVIDPRSATFDLSGAAADAKTFVFQQGASITSGTILPTLDQFGGSAGAPDIFALRSDSGAIDFDNLDFTSLPVDPSGAVSRVIFEAAVISLNQTDSSNPDLDLESPNGLQLRFRTDRLELSATSGGEDENGGRVLAGTTAPTVIGNDADFDADTLLIEGFDRESETATVENLSSLSADTEGGVDFDLADGGGPNEISITQNGSVLVDDLPENGSISGLLASGTEEDEDDNPIATIYRISSLFGSVALDPTKVDGSNLSIFGVANTPIESAINFAAGTYDLDRLLAQTPDSILILSNTTFIVKTMLTLAAGLIPQPTTPVTAPLGSLEFGAAGAAPSIDLRANQIELRAGPFFTLRESDGSGDEIDPAFLPKIRLDGLAEVERTGDFQDSTFSLAQSADLDLTIDANSDGVPDLIEALENNPADPTTVENPDGLDWQDVEIVSTQGTIQLSGIDHLVDVTENLTVESGTREAIVTDLEDHAIDFGDFAGNVVYFSNDITFRTTSPTKQLDLASSNLELRSAPTDSDELLPLPDADDLSKLRDDPDALERPIVRIEQVADFDATSALPLPAQYTIDRSTLNTDGSVNTLILPRADLANLDIELRVTGAGETLVLDDAIRDRVYGSNLILKSAADVLIDLNSAAAGYGLIDAAALQLSSLDIRTAYDPITDLGGGGNIFFTIMNFPTAEQAGFDPLPDAILTTGDQRWDGNVVLQETLTVGGRDITFTGDISVANPTIGLDIQTAGKVSFQGAQGSTDTIGSLANPLAFLTVLFENGSSSVPNVEFGRRDDPDGDGSFDTPLPSDQFVYVEGDILFEADNATATEPGVRTSSAPFATIGKGLGDLTFVSNSGDFTMGTGEKLSVAGTATIDARNGDVRLGDVSALEIDVIASNIALARRVTGTYFDGVGETQHDRGPTITANRILFEDMNGMVVAPSVVGAGKDPIFGVPNPFSASTYPTFLDDFSVFEIKPNGDPLNTNDFRFASSSPQLNEQIPIILPGGSSRSDLSGAFGPYQVPLPGLYVSDPPGIVHPDRLFELGVDPRVTSNRVRQEQLRGAAVIDDSEYSTEIEYVSVTESRLNATDVEIAIKIHGDLFGAEGERADQIRGILQAALDRYLEETRVRRVIGFEFRRFVRNRPSTLIEAYETLDSLDALFRYHRRLGLSPGEYRKIQREWLRDIQPEGITLDELAETVHPSRYVRGSDILDIFGQ